MKKIVLIALVIISFLCISQTKHFSIKSDSARGLGENLLIKNDTILEGDQLWLAVINNNAYNVIVNGNLVATSTVIQDGGVLDVKGDLTVGNALRFFDGNGLVKIQGNTVVGNSVTGTGTVEHCGFFDPPLDTESTITIIQECETLSIKQFYLSQNKLPENTRFEIYDVSGKNLFTGNTDNYSLDYLASGLYFLKFEGIDETIKYIKN